MNRIENNWNSLDFIRFQCYFSTINTINTFFEFNLWGRLPRFAGSFVVRALLAPGPSLSGWKRWPRSLKQWQAMKINHERHFFKCIKTAERLNSKNIEKCISKKQNLEKCISEHTFYEMYKYAPAATQNTQNQIRARIHIRNFGTFPQIILGP